MYGSVLDEVDACTQGVVDGDELKVNEFTVKCLHMPGHTKGHVCYYIDYHGDHAVFTGAPLYCIDFLVYTHTICHP